MGGGWKQFEGQKVEKEELYRLAETVLGVGERDCVEFFGAVEHPILYTTCSHHHFHIPVYSRVVIRDVDTLEPVPMGTPGLVNLMTPMVGSMPLPQRHHRRPGGAPSRRRLPLRHPQPLPGDSWAGWGSGTSSPAPPGRRSF